jgi:mono/diheme cytochrome c family protein
MLNAICTVTLVAATAILIRVTIRAWWIRNLVLRCASVVVSAVLTVIFAATTSVMVLGLYRLHARSAPEPELKVEITPERVQRGEDIVNGFCGSCHSRAGTLTGGSDFGKKFPLPIGSLVPSNLTPAGELKHWSDGAIFRAIRNGVDANGRWLVVMSITNAGNLSDDDIESLIAYIRQTPAAGTQTPEPPDVLNPLGVAMLGAGLLPRGRPVITAMLRAPAKAPTAQYGGYILSYQDCRQCHGDDLAGGKPGLAPVGPDLTVVKGWTREQFFATLRTGTDPNGHDLDRERMPWRDIGKMDDTELAALYEYLDRLPGK